MRKQGRHKYFALASTEVAAVLEALMGLAADVGHLRSRAGPKDKALRQARICYNHLAGHMGVQMFDGLLKRKYLESDDGRLQLTTLGRDFVVGLGIDIDRLMGGRPELCRECLDWSERRSHLSGSLGRAMLARFVEMNWARVDSASRIVTFTPSGLRQFNSMLSERIRE